MEQNISIADLAAIYRAVNEVIEKLSEPFISIYRDPKTQLQKHKDSLKKNLYFQSLLHVKKTLEKCNLKINVPDIKVEN